MTSSDRPDAKIGKRHQFLRLEQEFVECVPVFLFVAGPQQHRRGDLGFTDVDEQLKVAMAMHGHH
jgi:hypothetical protein